MMDMAELKTFASLAQREITGGAAEDKLRHLLSAHLNKIFPDSPWWVQEHVLGTETYLHFANKAGKERIGFADSVVGKTAIEYEKNLTVSGIFAEGYHQVKEYCAALCNLGIEPSEILGILSDTVRWYGYSIEIVGNQDKARLYGADDIKLIEHDFTNLSLGTKTELSKFELFVNKYLGRYQSRLLTAKALVLDFGLESDFYKKEIAKFKMAVSAAMNSKPAYAELIRNVWQNFVAYLGASEYSSFSEETYVNEFYLVTVAKIICANVLNGKPLLCDKNEIRKIINGGYFLKKNIQNLVDYDYFGWLNNGPYADNIVDSVSIMQKLLSGYDFNLIAEEDLFGELLAQLSNREHRLLLGQDFTPHWVAESMVKFTLGQIDEEPRMLDMCCGSGVFLIEAIREVRKKYNVSVQSYDDDKDNIIFSCVMGFDIDPLAVMLAKVNWILSMRDLFSVHKGIITIPVYHADSLFVATPITHNMPQAEDESFVLHFGSNEVEVPGYMMTPKRRKIFDAFMSVCYNFAMQRAQQEESALTDEQLDALTSSIEMESNMSQSIKESQAQRIAAYSLVLQLESLQRQGKNGIWYFILSNSYKPGLVANQFNCIISNPPWLAMSRLADNPYKRTLQTRTAEFGIKPPGASHLHMELATTFLLVSIDRYLKKDARWLCVMPGSILSGYNHDPLRLEKYRDAMHPVDTNIDTIWELPASTFKNKAIVLGGKKIGQRTRYPVSGRNYEESGNYTVCEYTLNRQGNRSAWTNKGGNAEVINLINQTPLAFNQGADIFPRTALFHEYSRQSNGSWSVMQIERTSDLYYLISESKKDICNSLEADGFSDKYMYDCLISKHLSPFIVTDPAKVIIPGVKKDGKWRAISGTDTASMNSGTSYVFNEIQEKSGMPLATLMLKKINIRNKLDKQNFSLKRWLILSNAGGANPCAAYIDLEKYDRSKLIIDQTLYWYLAESEQEAIYLAGMLNSTALSRAISDFQPKGGFGARHIHTIPYKIIPQYDANDDAQKTVVEIVGKLIDEWVQYCEDNAIGKYLNPNCGTLNSRRRKLQGALKTLNSYKNYEAACKAVLCVDDP